MEPKKELMFFFFNVFFLFIFFIVVLKEYGLNAKDFPEKQCILQYMPVPVHCSKRGEYPAISLSVIFD